MSKKLNMKAVLMKDNLVFPNEMRDDLSTPKPTPQQFGMSEQAYADALDNIVKVSVDTFVVDSDDRVLLGERLDWPVKGLWCFGGRMLPRETFRQTVSRNINRELAIKLTESDELEIIGHYSFVWDKRKEGVVNNGFHDLLIFMKYIVEDRSVLSQDSTHSALQWFTKSELRTLKSSIHPYLWRGLVDAGLV